MDGEIAVLRHEARERAAEHKEQQARRTTIMEEVNRLGQRGEGVLLRGKNDCHEYYLTFSLIYGRILPMLQPNIIRANTSSISV